MPREALLLVNNFAALCTAVNFSKCAPLDCNFFNSV